MTIGAGERLALTGKDTGRKKTDVDRVIAAIEGLAAALKGQRQPAPVVNVEVPVPDVEVTVPETEREEFPRELVFDVERDRTGKISRLIMRRNG
jgi:hypothetical protein